MIEFVLVMVLFNVNGWNHHDVRVTSVHTTMEQCEEAAKAEKTKYNRRGTRNRAVCAQAMDYSLQNSK